MSLDSLRKIRLALPGLLFIACCQFGIKGHAQTFNFKTTEFSQKKTGMDLKTSGLPYTMDAAHDKWTTMTSNPTTWTNSLQFKSVHDFVKFSVNHAYPKVVDSTYIFKLYFQVRGYNTPSNSSLYTAINDSLIIAYNPDSLTSYQDMQVKAYTGYHRIQVVLNSLYDITNPLAAPVAVPLAYTQKLNFQVEASVLMQKYDKLSSVTITPSNSASVSNNYLNVSWTVNSSSTMPTPAGFELEWTYVDNYKDTGTTAATASALKYDFRNNSTRVWLDSAHSYRIPLIYQRGYIVYRVRMVRPDPSNYQYPVYTPWTITAQSGLVSSLTNGTHYYLLSDPHMADSMNWQYTISFAEQGKFKQVMSYYDGLLKNRQSITRFNSQLNKLIVTENIFDFEGRPAITTLPAPASSNAFQFQQGVAINDATSLPYHAPDFDVLDTSLCPGEVMPEKLKNTALASVYYSPQNPDMSGYQKFVPDAGGYPFVQSILSPGYADRVDKQGGAGDSLQIGTEHYSTYDYVDADQADLNRLLGVNAGWTGFYNKTVSKDPNGQLSMSVSDYEGKLVTSSVIGLGSVQLDQAIMQNENVPGAQYFQQDLIAGVPQQIIGNKRLLDKNFYMDVAGPDTVQYEYIFTPWFTGCPDKYLSVEASYWYKIFDQCGVGKYYEDSTLGINGVVSSPAPASFTASRHPLDLGQGKHSLHKELTVNIDDVYAAVDSFMIDKDNCLRNEPSFIREEVLERKYPCPREDDDPCTRKKKDMIDELKPGAKYGHYTMNGVGNVWGDGNSIFDVFRDDYRYRDTCIVNLPDSITKFGQVYTHLKSLPVATFIQIFTGSAADTIAEALLPLHPEYCKLLQCYPDTFKERMLAIPDALIAEGQGLLYLSDIIAADPIKDILITALGFTSPEVEDSLATFRGGLFRFDTLVTALSYCNCSDSVVYKTCLQQIFSGQISILELMNQPVKEKYFKLLVQLYLQNRERFKQYMIGSGGSFCAPCDSVRMHLTPPPVFTTIYTGNGGIDTSLGSFWNLFANDTLAGGGYMQSMIQTMGNMDSATAALYGDTATMVYNAYDSLLCNGQVDSIIARLANCFEGDAGVLNDVRDTLHSLCEQGLVYLGNYTPNQIRYALTINGISLGDLCNPFLVNYDLFDPAQGGSNANLSCKDPAFYESVKAFLNNGDVMDALTTSGTTSVSLSAFNPFEDEISNALGGTPTATVRSTYVTGDNYYLLQVYDAGLDTVNIYLRGTGSCSDAFDISLGQTVVVSSVKCIREAGYIGTGYISTYAFSLRVQSELNDVTTTCTLLGWNNKVEMAPGYRNKFDNCLPCTQMKALYVEFRDTMTAYNIKGVDHPYYEQMLRSFMNYKTGKWFSTDQYLRFIESCALADSMKLNNYVAYSIVKIKTDSLASFIAGINAVMANVSVSIARIEDSSGYKKLLIDFNQFPKNLLWKYKKYINDFSITGCAACYKYVNTLLNYLQASRTLGTITVPIDTVSNYEVLVTDYLNTVTVIHFDSAIVSLKYGSNYLAHKRYFIKGNVGITSAQISVVLDGVASFMNDMAVSGIFEPNYQSTIDEDYSHVNKQELLHYVYSLQGFLPYQVLDSMREENLNNRVYTGLGVSSTYTIPSRPGNNTNLYIVDPAGPGSLFARLSHIIDTVAFTNNNKITLAAGIDSLSVNPVKLVVYHCSDNTYWYRYFGAGDTLYNVFIRIPKYIPAWAHDQYELVPSSVVAEPGDSTSRYFTVSLSHVNDPGVIIKATGMTDFEICRNQTLEDVILGNPVTATIPVADTFDHCERQRLKAGIYEGKVRYALYMDSVRNALALAFYAHVMNNIEEKLYLGYMDQRFQTTLYFYDRAGNLIRTVPPEGVVKLDTALLDDVDNARLAGTQTSDVIPAHKKTSDYNYNSLNQVVKQLTPDGGKTHFFYDAQGRLIFSQNAQQGKTGSYTYTLYDKQSRIVETGQVKLGCPYFDEYVLPPSPTSYPPCYNLYTGDGNLMSPHPPVVHYVANNLHDSVYKYVRSKKREDVVLTVYDTAAKKLELISGMSPQENLRKRVSAIKFFTALYPTDSFFTSYDYCSYYCYDATGNVKTLTHHFPVLQPMNQAYKRIDYDYDLVSGKVNMLSYNRGFADQFYQRYGYDADNRITKVETSADGYIWKRDAEYDYYQHGPLARMSLGDLRVQGVDFAYTIQGWLKVINSDIMTPQADMGRDAVDQNSIHANDAAALSLHYFEGDYKPIGSDTALFLTNNGKNLYNGNIARQTTGVLPFPSLNTVYKYDQLNRIKMADYDAINPVNKTLAGINDYKTNYKYDQDGNLQKLVRFGNNPAGGIGGIVQVMDSLSYHYTAGQINNKLNNVTDSSSSTVYGNDISPYTNPAVSRYLYDAIGNTVKDLVSNQDTIKWNLYNKLVETQNHTAKNRLQFRYDGGGNRVTKSFTRQTDSNYIENSDYYVRDAQGNILAIYEGERIYTIETIKPFATINEELIAQAGSPAVCTEFLEPYFTSNSDFNDQVLNITNAHEPWLSARIAAQAPSFYLHGAGSLMNNMLLGTNSYIYALYEYDVSNTSTIIGDTWVNLFADGENGEGQTIWANALFIESNASYLLAKLCDQYSDIFKDILGFHSIPMNGCEADIPALVDFYFKAEELNSSALRNDLVYIYGSYPSEFEAWLRALSVDAAIFNNEYYLNTTDGVLIPVIQQNLATYSSFEALNTFFDGWEGSMGSLATIAEPNTLNEIIYNAAPGAYLLDYGNDVGFAFLDTAVAAVPGNTPAVYLAAAAFHIATIDQQQVELELSKIERTEWQRHWLAEHHLYGSSRLGIKYYWPDQHYISFNYDTSYINPVVDSITLNGRKPWHSAEYQDAIAITGLLPYNNTQTAPFTMQHTLGQKGYEVNNHLGNVHSVVTDKRVSVDTKNNDTIDRYRPSLRAAYDYYPFGMLMPERYVSDTTQQCAWITQTKFVPTWIYEEMWPYWDCAVAYCGFTAMEHPTLTVTDVGSPSAIFHVSASSNGAGAWNIVAVNAGMEEDILIDIDALTSGKEFTFLVEELRSGEWYFLTDVVVTGAGQQHLTFSPTGNEVRLSIMRTGGADGSANIRLRPFRRWLLGYSQQQVLVKVCNEAEDKYRMGFNGKEKDNEIKGIGNSLDFGARMYDSRTGRWMSNDPLAVKYPDLSPYSFVANNPIMFIDPDGMRIKIRHLTFNRMWMPIIVVVFYHRGVLTNKDGTPYTGDDAYILRAKRTLDNLRRNDPRYEKVISDAENDKDGAIEVNHLITNLLYPNFEWYTSNGEYRNSLPYGNRHSQVQPLEQEGTDKADQIKFDPDYDQSTPGGSDYSDEEILIHEMKHSWNTRNGYHNENYNNGTPSSPNGPNCEEVDAINFQNIQREKEGKRPRTKHSGKTIRDEHLTPPSKYQLQPNQLR